jgi:hypothetical protein
VGRYRPHNRSQLPTTVVVGCGEENPQTMFQKREYPAFQGPAEGCQGPHRSAHAAGAYFGRGPHFLPLGWAAIAASSSLSPGASLACTTTATPSTPYSATAATALRRLLGVEFPGHLPTININDELHMRLADRETSSPASTARSTTTVTFSHDGGGRRRT